VFEQPRATGWYAVGADRVKEEDRTVIEAIRMDESSAGSCTSGR
jgi:hypothetical protein